MRQVRPELTRGAPTKAKVFWFFFSKKNPFLNQRSYLAAFALAGSARKEALLFEKRSKDFCA
jgi:hypothetical protein